jgi:hypothetical protein
MSSVTWVTEGEFFPRPRVAGPVWSLLGDHHRYEWILIGTKKHPRLVLLRRDYANHMP